MKRILSIAALAAFCFSAMSFVVRVDSIPEELNGEPMFIRSELDDRIIDSIRIDGSTARLSGDMEQTEWCVICYSFNVPYGRNTIFRPIFIGDDDSVAVTIKDYNKGDLQMSGSNLTGAYSEYDAYMKSLMPMDHDTSHRFVEYSIALAHENKSNPLGAYLTQFFSYAVDEDTWMNLYDSLSPELKAYRPLERAHQRVSGRIQSQKGDMFKDIKGINSDGSAASLSDYVGKGKYVLVDFWASWCMPCRMEAKETLMPIYEKYKDDDRLMILGVMTSDSTEAHLRGLESVEYPWPQLIDTDNAAMGAYGFNFIPMIMLIAPDGTIAAREIRGQEIWDAVESALAD